VSYRHYAIIIFVSLVVTWVLTPLVRRISLQMGLMDEPALREACEVLGTSVEPIDLKRAEKARRHFES